MSLHWGWCYRFPEAIWWGLGRGARYDLHDVSTTNRIPVCILLTYCRTEKGKVTVRLQDAASSVYRKYRPRSDVLGSMNGFPRLLVEVDSSQNFRDKWRMFMQACYFLKVAKKGRLSENFFIFCIYLSVEWKADIIVLFESEPGVRVETVFLESAWSHWPAFHQNYHLYSTRPQQYVLQNPFHRILFLHELYHILRFVKHDHFEIDVNTLPGWKNLQSARTKRTVSFSEENENRGDDALPHPPNDWRGTDNGVGGQGGGPGAGGTNSFAPPHDGDPTHPGGTIWSSYYGRCDGEHQFRRVDLDFEVEEAPLIDEVSVGQ